jgi:hypothetical protein
VAIQIEITPTEFLRSKPTTTQYVISWSEHKYKLRWQNHCFARINDLAIVPCEPLQFAQSARGLRACTLQRAAA